jgi:Flp pilus assembly protein TadB
VLTPPADRDWGDRSDASVSKEQSDMIRAAPSQVRLMAMEQGEETLGERYTRTPFLKRVPTVGSLALALILAKLLGHSLLVGLLIFAGTLILCVLVLHFVFRQPLERLLRYREFEEA